MRFFSDTGAQVSIILVSCSPKAVLSMHAANGNPLPTSNNKHYAGPVVRLTASFLLSLVYPKPLVGSISSKATVWS